MGCSLLSSFCLCSVMSSSFSCLEPRLVRAAKDVKRRDNSFEALSTTPEKVFIFTLWRGTTTRLYVHLVWIVKHSLCSRWVSAKRDGIHFPTPRFGEIFPKINKKIFPK